MPVLLTETAIQAAAKKVAAIGRMDLADATLPGLRCVSAWKKDPVGGVIGVQKGPL
jgi:hypothetical protein